MYVNVDLDDEELSGCVCFYNCGFVVGVSNVFDVMCVVFEGFDGEWDCVVEVGDVVGVGWWLVWGGYCFSVVLIWWCWWFLSLL